jgi:uncharacterized PurR-regulated membrane protein YhhQ (DUF165 family)
MTNNQEIRMNRTIGYAAALAFVLTIVGANWLIVHYGIVPVGFGLMAPAGVFAAGLAFTLRDIAQQHAGKGAVLAAIAVGAALSALVSSPELALASAVAFTVSELADLAVYTPLRKRGMVRAVLASNVVGSVADSALFLWLAFGSLAFLPGQVVGKLWMTLAAVAVLVLARRRWAVA